MISINPVIYYIKYSTLAVMNSFVISSSQFIVMIVMTHELMACAGTVSV